MATNQRENARREKKYQKEKKKKTIVWIVLAVIIVILIALKVSEIDFSNVKDSLSNNSNSSSLTVESGAYPYNIDSAVNTKLYSVNSKLNISTKNSTTVLDPKDAKVLYNYSYEYGNPVTKNAGAYILTFDQGSYKFRLDNNKKNIYEEKSDNIIYACDVSKNGNVMYATSSNDNKAVITVINSSLKKLATFTVNDGYVVSVAIDSTGKKCAYAVINSKNAKIVTTIYTINIGDTKPRKSFDFAGTSVEDLHYSSSNSLYFIGDNNVSIINSQKNLTTVFKTNSVHSVCYNYTQNNQLVYVYSDFASSNENVLTYINSNGKVKTSVKLSTKAKFVTSSNNEMTVLFNNKIIGYSLSKGEQKYSVNCDESVNSIYKMASKIFVQKQQIVDVINQKD